MVNKYGWVDMGSSFLPSEFNAAFLWAQLEQLDDIQDKRKHIWEMYYNGLNGKVGDMVRLPFIPEYATNNGHMFYLLCPSLEYRIALMTYLKENDVQTTSIICLFIAVSTMQTSIMVLNCQIVTIIAIVLFVCLCIMS